MQKLFTPILSQPILFIGDTFVLALITITGFATHGEVDRVTRMLTTFIPLLIAWFFIAPFFGLFSDKLINEPVQLWRVLWAMIAVAPLASWLRSLWLKTPILPLFVLVILGSSALTMLIWRVVYLLISRYNRQ